MPLAFSSLSHGTVAFGFFNIEVEMLLLDRLFFFAEDFCGAVVHLAGGALSKPGAAELPAYRIDDAAKVGNLHGAIAGVDLSGFIGATYSPQPFPRDPAEFKQRPEGAASRAEIEALVEGFGLRQPIELSWEPGAGVVALGGYLFDGRGFDELIGYVDRGGYPRWKDEVRPPYVSTMVRALAEPPPWR